MATDRQIQANRRNARKSTGPRTPEGKAASRFNALQYGIHAESQCIPGEDPAELAALTRDYYGEYQPQGPTQRFLVDRLNLCHWLRQRYHRIQAELLGQLAFEVEERSQHDESEILIGHAFLRSTVVANDVVVKIFRQINANDRTYDRTLATLERLRAEAQDSKPDTPLAAEPQPSSKLASFPLSPEPAAPAPRHRSEPHNPDPQSCPTHPAAPPPEE